MKSSPHFRLTLPATSANLGPAFDAAALAFDLALKLAARPAADYSIKATGRDPEICGALENHLILTTYREILQSAKRPEVPLVLKISNQIPIGKGCGSSAAARLAGIALAVHFGSLRWTSAQIIGEALSSRAPSRQRRCLLARRPDRCTHELRIRSRSRAHPAQREVASAGGCSARPTFYRRSPPRPSAPIFPC